MARKVFPMMSQNGESSFYINASLKNTRCYRYGEKCGNSLLHNSKFKIHKNFYIIYHTYRILYNEIDPKEQNHQHNSILTTMHDLSDVSYIFFAFMVGIPKPDNT